jgi:hypothetical protein
MEMTGGPRELANHELYLLRLHEDEISRAEQTHYQALAKAYSAIREKRLFRREGTFADYCKARWGRSPQAINRIIKAGEVAADLEANSQRAPMSEKQARSLGRLSRVERMKVA